LIADYSTSKRAVNGNSDEHGLPLHLAGLYFVFMSTTATTLDTRGSGVSYTAVDFASPWSSTWTVTSSAPLPTGLNFLPFVVGGALMALFAIERLRGGRGS